jgi:TonB family protein
MTSIFIARIKLWRVAFTIAIVVSVYPVMESAGLAKGAQQDKQPSATTPGQTTPVQIDNDPQLPVVITEAQAEVGEPYDISARFPFPPFLRVPLKERMKRIVMFTMKLKNQGDRPVTGLKFAIQSPLFGNSSIGTQGKNSSLEANEEVVITFGSSVDDREDVLALVRNMRLKPLEVSYESEPSIYDKYVSQSLSLDGQNIESGRQINVVAFHELKKFTPKDSDGTNKLRLIRAEPPKHDPNSDRLMDAMESVYEMSESLRPNILYKEKAEYTPEARANKVRGTVVLNVIFGADGSIRVLRVVSGLPHGLAGQALKAAQRVRFEPAVKDGKPVDVRGNLEFSFDLDQ